MIVVVDTNVYISALVFGGNPRTILRLAEERRIRIAISLPLLAELAETLSVKFAWLPSQVAEALRMVSSAAELHYPDFVIHEYSDPDDNRALECAIAAGATWIVTGDRHLLVLHPWRSVSIVTPSVFLSEWEGATPSAP